MNEYKTDTTQLSFAGLKKLVLENSLALSVNDYLAEDERQHIIANINQLNESSETLNGGAPINRFGVPWFTSKHGETSEARYFDAAAWQQKFRELCLPHVTPMDRLIRELDYLWPGGAVQGSVDGKKMCVGLIRDIAPNGQGLPWHVDADKYGPHGRHADVFSDCKTVLFGNIYLQTDG